MSTDMDDRERIAEIYRLYWRYMIEKDADGLILISNKTL